MQQRHVTPGQTLSQATHMHLHRHESRYQAYALLILQEIQAAKLRVAHLRPGRR